MSNPFSRWSARWSSAPKPIAAPKAPTAEELAADQKVLDKSVADAVNAALQSEEFTKAVAAHLAQQIEPTLKSALDISAVEAKILASNDSLAQRVNEIETGTTTKISELSTLVGTNSTTTSDKISSVDGSVGAVKATLAGLEASVKGIQDQLAAPDNSILSSHTAKLDAISAAVQTFQEQHSSFASILASTVAKVDLIIDRLDTVKSELGATIKTSNGEVSAVGAQVGSVLTAIEAQNGTLAELKSTDKIDAILAALKTSNDHQVSHSTALAGIQIPSLSGLEAKVDGLSTAVAEISAKDVSAEILASVKSVSDSQTTQSATVSEIKTIVSTPAAAPEKTDLSGLETSLQKVISAIDGHNVTLAEIKSTVSAPPPAAEKTDLSGLETSIQKVITGLDGQAATLADVKAAAEKDNNADLKASVEKVIASLDAQTATLSDIKTTVAVPAPIAEKTDLSGLEASVGKVITALDAQSATLEASKAKLDSLSTVDILTEVKSVKTAVAAIPAPTPADNSDLIKEVQSVKAAVEETKKETESIIVLVKASAAAPKENATPAAKLNGVKTEAAEVEAEAATAA